LIRGAVVLGGIFAAAALHAQTYEQVAPKTPPVSPAPGLPDTAASPARVKAAGEQLIVPTLRGLVFLADRAALNVQGRDVSGLHVEGEPLLETAEFRALADAYLGQPLTIDGLDRLTREVVFYFRRHGRPVVDVLAPEQQVANGTVQILVVEGRLGEVRVEGNRWFSSEQIRSAIRGRTGGVIEGAPLLEDLAWLNENAFREIDLVFMRGRNSGDTDIVLRTRDRRPVRGYAGYEDSGNELTGRDRLFAGVNLGNAFGNGQQFNYQLTGSTDWKKLVAHSASYVVPLPQWRHTLTLFGSYAESRPDLADPVFALRGRSAQLSARYRVPLPARNMWTGAVTWGADFKRSNNNLSFGGSEVFAQETDVIQALATLAGSHLDKRGAWSAQLALALSPGGIGSANGDAAYAAARALARPDYAYARLTLDRRTKLPGGATWVAWGIAQLATSNLLGSEQLGLGGAGGLRGYDEREANGDDGFIVVNELHGPPLHLTRAAGAGPASDGLDPLLFFDYGRVRSHERLPGEPSSLELSSVGVGARYQFGTALSARFDYGWQLKASGLSSSGRSSRAHVSVTISR
jgi:hemolysin activation/secretion protein